MENTNQPIRKHTIYEVTSCYFCSEFLDNNDFKSHLETCGQALQKCPNDCLAYVQRKFMEQHLSTCPKSNADNNSSASIDIHGEYFQLEQNITLLRSSLHEEIRQRHRLISDLGALRRNFAEDSANRALESESFQQEVAKLHHQYKEVQEWRRELRMLLDKFHQDLEFRNEATLSFESLFCERDRINAKMESIECEIDKIKCELEKTNNNSMTLVNDNSLDSGTGSLRNSSPIRCQRCPFLEWKLSESLLELRQMKNTVYETEVKCENMQKFVHDATSMCARTKQELHDLQVHLAAEKQHSLLANNKGHLIWRIDNFSEKLKDAKQYDITLKSPLFTNKHYGYTLRIPNKFDDMNWCNFLTQFGHMSILDVLLNGIGTWKGRNILACLNVVAGEWDALLQWPCKLSADIILRNQSDDSSQNFSKTITVKKQDANYESNQYIFISHKTIQNQQFIKNDCIFFEVFVHKSK